MRLRHTGQDHHNIVRTERGARHASWRWQRRPYAFAQDRELLSPGLRVRMRMRIQNTPWLFGGTRRGRIMRAWLPRLASARQGQRQNCVRRREVPIEAPSKHQLRL